jgi:hypothetical protein
MVFAQPAHFIGELRLVAAQAADLFANGGCWQLDLPVRAPDGSRSGQETPGLIDDNRPKSHIRYLGRLLDCVGRWE